MIPPWCTNIRNIRRNFLGMSYSRHNSATISHVMIILTTTKATTSTSGILPKVLLPTRRTSRLTTFRTTTSLIVYLRSNRTIYILIPLLKSRLNLLIGYSPISISSPSPNLRLFNGLSVHHKPRSSHITMEYCRNNLEKSRRVIKTNIGSMGSKYCV